MIEFGKGFLVGGLVGFVLFNVTIIAHSMVYICNEMNTQSSLFPKYGV